MYRKQCGEYAYWCKGVNHQFTTKIHGDQSRGFYPTSGISYVQPLSLPPPSLKKKKNKKNIRKSSWKVRNSVPYLLCLVYLPFFVFNSIARKNMDNDNNILTHFLRSFHPRYPRKGDDSAKAAIRTENTMIPFLFHKGKRVMIGYMEHKKPCHLLTWNIVRIKVIIICTTDR